LKYIFLNLPSSLTVDRQRTNLLDLSNGPCSQLEFSRLRASYSIERVPVSAYWPPFTVSRDKSRNRVPWPRMLFFLQDSIHRFVERDNLQAKAFEISPSARPIAGQEKIENPAIKRRYPSTRIGEALGQEVLHQYGISSLLSRNRGKQRRAPLT
jgi:hypothetical protein